MAQSNSERQKAHRGVRKERGDFMLTCWLEKPNAEKLERLVKESGLTREKIINQLLENS